jgi:hypothetical protein
MINTDPASLLDLFNKVLAGRANEGEMLELIAWLKTNVQAFKFAQAEAEITTQQETDAADFNKRLEVNNAEYRFQRAHSAIVNTHNPTEAQQQEYQAASDALAAEYANAKK